MLEKLKRPLVKPLRKTKERVVGFVSPIKGAVSDLLGKLPSPKAMAGSKDLGESGSAETAGQAEGKVGFLDRLKKFKNSLKEMSDFQKLILVTIAVCLPAGILIATVLVGVFKRHKKK